MRKPSFRALMLFGLSALSGCASFQGEPQPVISVAMSDKVLSAYQVPAVLKRYGGLSGLAQRAYRDEVISVYTQAIDARYNAFRGNLSSESKGVNLGFDSLLVGLVGAAALSANDADEIGAVTTGVLGLRGSVDKNLYFERTLPALIAAMDAERYKVRTSMVQNQAQDTMRYPLAAALVELQEYQQAGSIVAGIAAVTDQAAQSRDEAKQDYERRVRFACDSADAVNAAIDPVGTFVSDLGAAAAAEEARGGTAALNRLRLAADAFGIGAAGTMSRARLENAIDDALLGGFCTLEEIEALKQRLRAGRVGFTTG